MCAPLAALAAGAALVGAGVSAVGQIASGQYNAAVDRQNAANLDYAAADATTRGDIAANQKRSDTQRVIGAQRAGMSGVDLSTGSSLDVLVGTAGIGEQDALTIQNNAAREAWGYKTQANYARNQARFSKSQGYFGAASTILTGSLQAQGILSRP